MQSIPISDVPSQTLTTTLGGQYCRLRLITRRDQLYLDLHIDEVLILAGALCKAGVRIVRDAYLGFSGELVFVDTQGTADPASPGLGTRYLLMYASTEDLAAG